MPSLCDPADARTTSLGASVTAVPPVSMATPTVDHVTVMMPVQKVMSVITTPDAASVRWVSLMSLNQTCHHVSFRKTKYILLGIKAPTVGLTVDELFCLYQCPVLGPLQTFNDTAK